MQRRLKTVALVAVVVAAALVPLFGDPRVTPVTHPLWARMLLRALEMNDAVKASSQASDVFAALSWRDSRAFPADDYLRSDGIVVAEEGGRRTVAAPDGTGEVSYAIAVVQAGDYQLRARLSGDPARPASAEIAPMGGAPALRTFTLVPGAASDWVFAGTAHLDPGAYTASLLLPPGTSLEYVEVAPPCVNPVEPAGGWRPRAVTTGEDVALTSLKALDLEHELAPADSPIEREGASFQLEDAEVPAPGEEPSRTLRGGRHGRRALLVVDLPEAGLYTLSAFVRSGNGQRWRADGCRKAVVCPGAGPGWLPVMTQSFSAGRHTVAVTLTEGAEVERVRLERKKATPSDYVAALRRLGFDPGEGALTRERALEAMRFVRSRRDDLAARLCGDVTEPAGPPPALAPQVAQATAPAGPGPSGVRPVDPGVGGSLLPPQEAASPVTPGVPSS